MIFGNQEYFFVDHEGNWYPKVKNQSPDSVSPEISPRVDIAKHQATIPEIVKQRGNFIGSRYGRIIEFGDCTAATMTSPYKSSPGDGQIFLAQETSQEVRGKAVDDQNIFIVNGQGNFPFEASDDRNLVRQS